MPLPGQGQVLGYPAGKAYARYLGCYEQQQQLCSPSNALADLTGERRISSSCARAAYTRGTPDCESPSDDGPGGRPLSAVLRHLGGALLRATLRISETPRRVVESPKNQ
ncbi:hypothetical protein HPB47_001549 [Ixodes persulcatus]|uniref:Uncharacterized protein n=1 Tax=Ixodes persulcatus TaxID=34615 RepID=A0AC60PNW0_IXOPE|nr:hypothetical protein HPB47_001549 [Ixodes persulcatus]